MRAVNYKQWNLLLTNIHKTTSHQWLKLDRKIGMSTVRGRLRNENSGILLKDNKKEIGWTGQWKEFHNSTTEMAYLLVNFKWTYFQAETIKIPYLQNVAPA